MRWANSAPTLPMVLAPVRAPNSAGGLPEETMAHAGRVRRSIPNWLLWLLEEGGSGPTPPFLHMHKPLWGDEECLSGQEPSTQWARP